MTQLQDIKMDEIQFEPADGNINDYVVTFRGVNLGFIDEVNVGPVFHPYVGFDEDEMDVVLADDMDQMKYSLFDEIDRCLELIEQRRESGWYANL